MQPKMNTMVPHRRISKRGRSFHKEDIGMTHNTYLVTLPDGSKYRHGNHSWHGVQEESYYADSDSDRQTVDLNGTKLRGYSTYEYWNLYNKYEDLTGDNDDRT